MYYAIGVSVSSLHRESTDSLIRHLYMPIIVQNHYLDSAPVSSSCVCVCVCVCVGVNEPTSVIQLLYLGCIYLKCLILLPL